MQAVTLTAGAIVLIALSIVLIKPYGLNGIAFAMAATAILVTGVAQFTQAWIMTRKRDVLEFEVAQQSAC